MKIKNLNLLIGLSLMGICFGAYEATLMIEIDSEILYENGSINTEIGKLNTIGGQGPYTYEINSGYKDGEKFYLSGDDVYAHFSADYENPSSSSGTNNYTISVKSTDSNIPTFAKDVSYMMNANGGWFYNAGSFPNLYGFAGIRPDGSILARGSEGAIGTGSIDNTVPSGTGYTQIIGNYKAFAALKSDGSISNRGIGIAGGTGNITGTGFTELVSNGEAFAALRSDGSIVSRGKSDLGGDNMAPAGTGFIQIYPNRYAFAALKPDGSITAWGSGLKGGSGAPTGTGFVKIFGSQNAFAALKADGSISVWGDAAKGGSGAPTGTEFTKIYGNNYAFAALKSDGSIRVWGTAGRGGNGGPAGTGFVDIFGNGHAFAALKTDGSIVAWGHTSYGGSGAPTRSGYIKAIGGGNAYAALKDDGSIATRGWGAYGGVGGPSDTGYIDIFGTYQAFAALKPDGSITTWGNALYGGSGGPTDTGYNKILSLDDSFIAIKPDSSVKGWGNTINNFRPAGTMIKKVGATYTKDITISVHDIDEIVPTADVIYSTTGATNGDVIVTLTNNSEPITITNNSGNTTYTFTENGEFAFEFIDAAGNTGSTTAVVNRIDRTVPTGYTTYSTTNPTNTNVIISLTGLNKTVTITNNSGSETYIFTENGTFTFEFVDIAGNTGSVTSSVNRIDKTNPIADIEYTPNNSSSGNITATLTNNSEPITITNNSGNTTYTFTENGEFAFEFIDAAGNTGSTTAVVNRIDRTVPTANISYSETSTTKNDVTATVTTPSEEITIINNQGNNSFIFTGNGTFTFIYIDQAGNRGEITAVVDWIDKNSHNGGGEITSKDFCPNGDISESYYDGTCGDELVHNSPNDGTQTKETYTTEQISIYKRAYNNKIINDKPIDEAELNGVITRAKMADIIVNFGEKKFKKKIATGQIINFSDIGDVEQTQQTAIIKAYQLGLMGIDMSDKFYPNKVVSRAEFATILGRLLYNIKTDGSDFYYIKPLQMLYKNKFITNTNPNIQEIKRYILLTLMRIKN